MKPRIMASSPEISMTTSRRMSSSVIGMGQALPAHGEAARAFATRMAESRRAAQVLEQGGNIEPKCLILSSFCFVPGGRVAAKRAVGMVLRPVYSRAMTARHPSCPPLLVAARRGFPSAAMSATRLTRLATSSSLRPGSPASARAASGTTARAKPSFCGFLEPRGGLRHRPHRAGQRHLAEIDRIGRQRRVGERGHQRRGGGEIGGRLLDAQAAGDVEIDVVAAELARRNGPPARPAPSTAGSDPSRPRRGAACRARSARPAPGFRPAAAACPRCRRTPRCRASRDRARTGTARTDWRPRAGRGRSSRTRRSRRSGRSGSSPRAGCGTGASLRPRTTAPRRPCARPRGGRRSGRPW